jgi:hypothetical protein
MADTAAHLVDRVLPSAPAPVGVHGAQGAEVPRLHRDRRLGVGRAERDRLRLVEVCPNASRCDASIVSVYDVRGLSGTAQLRPAGASPRLWHRAGKHWTAGDSFIL